ncbi:hypothetical protein GJ496_010862 [Pomphorhynchus laevis]|nr:hypothetical protein GJ496_010862 [Pomphorhynchus laevis]
MTGEKTDVEESQWEQKLKQLNSEFLEYQQFSRSLEEELQLQINHQESEIQQLRRHVLRLEEDKRKLIDRLSDVSNTAQTRIFDLEERISQSEHVNTKYASQLQQLEQLNDNLERLNRATSARLKDKESAYDEILEKNALLDSYIEEHTNQAHVEIQRLKDELKNTKKSIDNHKDKMTIKTRSTSNVEYLCKQCNGTDVASHVLPDRNKKDKTNTGSVRFLNYIIEKIDGIDKELVRCCRKTSMSPTE